MPRLYLAGDPFWRRISSGTQEHLFWSRAAILISNIFVDRIKLWLSMFPVMYMCYQQFKKSFLQTSRSLDYMGLLDRLFAFDLWRRNSQSWGSGEVSYFDIFLATGNTWTWRISSHLPSGNIHPIEIGMNMISSCWYILCIKNSVFAWL